MYTHTSEEYSLIAKLRTMLECSTFHKLSEAILLSFEIDNFVKPQQNFSVIAKLYSEHTLDVIAICFSKKFLLDCVLIFLKTVKAKHGSDLHIN